jgi:hypothetical protein
MRTSTAARTRRSVMVRRLARSARRRYTSPRSGHLRWRCRGRRSDDAPGKKTERSPSRVTRVRVWPGRPASATARAALARLFLFHLQFSSSVSDHPGQRANAFRLCDCYRPHFARATHLVLLPSVLQGEPTTFRGQSGPREQDFVGRQPGRRRSGRPGSRTSGSTTCATRSRPGPFSVALASRR